MRFLPIRLESPAVYKNPSQSRKESIHGCKYRIDICCKRLEKSNFCGESRFSLDVFWIPSIFSELLNEDQSRNTLKYEGNYMDHSISVLLHRATQWFECYIQRSDQILINSFKSLAIFDCFVQCPDQPRPIFQYCPFDTNYR
jgi:hypothetical protein